MLCFIQKGNYFISLAKARSSLKEKTIQLCNLKATRENQMAKYLMHAYNRIQFLEKCNVNMTLSWDSSFLFVKSILSHLSITKIWDNYWHNLSDLSGVKIFSL